MAIHTDRSGEKHGHLELLHREPDTSPIRYLCRCVCGTEKSIRIDKILSGNTVSCGCKKTEDMQQWNGRNQFTGQKFGRLTVIGETRVNGYKQWKCACDCGGEKITTTLYLKNSEVPSCGCYESEKIRAIRFRDLTGMKFGLLTTSEFRGFDTKRKSTWLCTCICGGTRLCRGNDLLSGATVSCGCAASRDEVIMTEEARAASAARCARRRARKRNAGGSYTASQINELYAKQKGCCAWCKKPLSKSEIRRDHRQSLARGGDNTIHNIEILCHDCNSRKSAKDPIEWAQENGFLL